MDAANLDVAGYRASVALSVVAGALIGFDRGDHGRPAGLRTTLLVSLAAAVAII